MATGITFDETMRGQFALEENKVEISATAGKKGDDRLAMHVKVTIVDLDAFTKDPDHQGDLKGTIDFPPIGMGISSQKGIFNLFSPSDDPAMRYMVYELPFSEKEKTYYLAGKKRVGCGSALDIWKETTTLYTTLHQGEDSNAPEIGSGVLRLGMRDLLKLMATIKAPGADSGMARYRAIAKFGRFFIGNLWNLYNPWKTLSSEN